MRRCHWIAATVLLLAGLVFGLIFTSINRLREAAARSKCQGNFKQLALAMHVYSSSHSTLPAGTVPNADLPPEKRLSWYVSILFYIEQDKVLKEFDLSLGANDTRNQSATDNRFPQSVCPATDEYRAHVRGGKWESPTPLAHYIGVAGIGANAATLPMKDPKTGAFGYDRRAVLSIDGFLDGTSNTLLLIETANEPGHWAFGGPATIRGVEPGESPYIGPGRPFGGFHSERQGLFGKLWNGCNVAMADGSCRSFSDTTSPEVLEALATAGGKEQLPSDW